MFSDFVCVCLLHFQKIDDSNAPVTECNYSTDAPFTESNAPSTECIEDILKTGHSFKQFRCA